MKNQIENTRRNASTVATPVEKRKGWNNTRNNQPELKRNRRVFRTGIINRQRPLENAEDNVARWGSNNSVIGDRGTPYPRPWPLPDPTEARRPGRRFETEVRKRRATADKESTIAKSDGQGNNEREERQPRRQRKHVTKYQKHGSSAARKVVLQRGRPQR